jgi:hypothetical protein
MRFYWLLLGMLALWRVTHLLNAEDGPWDLLVGFRRLVGRVGLGSLVDCFACLSVWVSAPLAWWLGESWKEAVLLWPAMSAGAMLAERLTRTPREPITRAAIYYEEQETDDELLREPKKSVSTGTRPQ